MSCVTCAAAFAAFLRLRFPRACSTMSNLFSLASRVAFVTGGSRGIGACIAETLAKNGCTHVAITYNTNKSMAEDVEKRIAGINGSKASTDSISNATQR